MEHFRKSVDGLLLVIELATAHADENFCVSILAGRAGAAGSDLEWQLAPTDPRWVFLERFLSWRWFGKVLDVVS